MERTGTLWKVYVDDDESRIRRRARSNCQVPRNRAVVTNWTIYIDLIGQDEGIAGQAASNGVEYDVQPGRAMADGPNFIGEITLDRKTRKHKIK